jgi:hypothetical protein
MLVKQRLWASYKSIKYVNIQNIDLLVYVFDMDRDIESTHPRGQIDLSWEIAKK